MAFCRTARTAHCHARGAAAGLIRLDAGQTVPGDDDAHDAHGHVSRAAHRVDPVAGVEVHRAVGDGDIDRAGSSGSVDPHPVAGVVVDVYPSQT